MILPLSLALVQACDLATTLLGFSLGYQEVGPGARWIMGQAGIAGLVLISIAGLSLELAILRWWPMPRRARPIAWATILAISLLPVLSNVATLFSW
jgi:hypothetical protein